MVANVSLGALEPESQRVVKWMQSVNFGRIWVAVRNGRLLKELTCPHCLVHGFS